MAVGYQEDKENRSPSQAGINLIDLIAGEGELCGVGSGSGTWGHGDLLRELSPIDLRQLAVVRSASAQDYREIVDQAAESFSFWRMVPAPKRGEVVRQIGTVLRWHQRELAEIVSCEVGKTRAEARGQRERLDGVVPLRGILFDYIQGRLPYFPVVQP